MLTPEEVDGRIREILAGAKACRSEREMKAARAIWAAAIEECARMVETVAIEHRDRQREVYGEEHTDVAGTVQIHTDTTAERFPSGPHCGQEGYFCEDFGCGSFIDLAAEIRAAR